MIKTFTVFRRIEGAGAYSGEMRDYLRASDDHGFDGCLIFQNNTNDIDPWTISQELLMCTHTLTPFIAVNPVYMHPYSVAHRILSFTRLYGRKLYLNFITGTSLSDLDAMNGLLTHEQRYDRLIEYIEVVLHLLSNPSPLSYEGLYYKTRNLRLSGTIDECYLPELFIAGSSEDAGRARRKTGAGRIEMAKPIGQVKAEGVRSAFNFGIVACPTPELARERLVKEFDLPYPEAREVLEYSLQNSDSVWKQQLLGAMEDPVFRLEPVKNCIADCPYLVGSYEQVADYIVNYVCRGVELFIVEGDKDDLPGIHAVMQRVMGRLSEPTVNH